jgi:hypothetical protein
MSWYIHRNNDRLEQEQLDILHALIEDAMHDVPVWLQANPSAEEKAHVVAVQAGLAELDRIVARRKDRQKEVRDDWVWKETLDDVKAQLEKAGGCARQHRW